jgi:methylmalonyl-CoA/ethylmalonyl-CoA epimerase
MTNVLGTNFVTQIGLVVRDIKKTAQTFADFFGMDVPEIKITQPVEQSFTQYHGEPSAAQAKLAFFNMGSLQLELIEPNDHPSTWREHLDQHGEGVHHIAFVVNDMKEKLNTLSGLNIPVIQKGEYKNGRYAYVDSTGPLKVILELLEND